jgi:hypothetical protein
MVALSFEERRNQFGGIRNQTLRVLKDGGYRKDGILANVGMAML